MMESLERWRQIWADPTPRIERHTCPTCGCRYTWHIPPPHPFEMPDGLPVVDVLHGVECTGLHRVSRARRIRGADDSSSAGRQRRLTAA